MTHEPCKFEDRILNMATDVAETKVELKSLSMRINGSMDRFADHIAQGRGWRMAITGSIVIIIINILAFTFFFGALNKTVLVNERILQRILEKYEHIIHKE